MLEKGMKILYVRVCFENNFLIFEYYENILNTVYLIFQGYLWIFKESTYFGDIIARVFFII